LSRQLSRLVSPSSRLWVCGGPANYDEFRSDSRCPQRTSVDERRIDLLAVGMVENLARHHRGKCPLRLRCYVSFMELRCDKCGSEKIRRSRLRIMDWPFLLLLRYPVRCRSCRDRPRVVVWNAFQFICRGNRKKSDIVQQRIEWFSLWTTCTNFT
jgi:predicted Zn-ribbon and HTH transcriptional regulator